MTNTEVVQMFGKWVKQDGVILVEAHKIRSRSKSERWVVRARRQKGSIYKTHEAFLLDRLVGKAQWVHRHCGYVVSLTRVIRIIRVFERWSKQQSR